MSYSMEISGSTATITPSTDRFDAYLAPEFRSTVTDALDKEVTSITVDMRNVMFVDSSGLGSIVSCHKLLQSANGIELVNVNHEVREIFRLTHMDKVFDLNKNSPDHTNNKAA